METDFETYIRTLLAAYNKLRLSKPLKENERLTVLITLFFCACFTLGLFSFVASYFRRREQQRASKRVFRGYYPWTVLACFPGKLFHSQRSAFMRDTLLLPLFKCASSTDIHMQADAVDAFMRMVDSLESKVLYMPITDIKVLCAWRHQTNPPIAPRINVALAVFAMSPSNRKSWRKDLPFKTTLEELESEDELTRFHALLFLSVVCGDNLVGQRVAQVNHSFETDVQSHSSRCFQVDMSAPLAKALSSVVPNTRAIACMFLAVLARHDSAISWLSNPNLFNILAALAGSSPDLRCTMSCCYVLSRLASFDDSRVALLQSNVLFSLLEAAVCGHAPTAALALKSLRQLSIGRRNVLRELPLVTAKVVQARHAAVQRLHMLVLLSNMELISSSMLAALPSTPDRSIQKWIRSIDACIAAASGPTLDAAASTDADQQQPQLSVRFASDAHDAPSALGRSSSARAAGARASGTNADFLKGWVQEGMRIFENHEADARIVTQCRRLMVLDVYNLVSEVAMYELPLLLKYLRVGYQRLNQVKPDFAQKIGPAIVICRPLEVLINALKAVRRDATADAKEIEQHFRTRMANGEKKVLVHSHVPAPAAPPPAAAAAAAGGSTGAVAGGSVPLPADISLVPSDWASDSRVTMSLADFQEVFISEYQAGGNPREIPSSGSLPALSINKQFARDVPNMIKVNGETPVGDTEEAMIRSAWTQIMAACDENIARAKKITAVANQNLGNWCYARLRARYQGRENVHVLQAGQHFVDIRTSKRGA
jgi:hypothetical protein